MEVAPSSNPETLDPNPHKSDLETPPPSISKDPSPLPPSASAPPSAALVAQNPTSVNPSPNPNPTLVAPPPPSIPSFRPLGAPPFPQYTISNTGLQNPRFSMAQGSSIQPPGVSATGAPIMHPGAASGAGAPMRPPGSAVYPAAPGQPPVGYGQVTNGYMTVPGAPPAFPPPGIARYPAPYPAIFRPGFPPRPLPPFGVIPQLTRPPIPGVRGPPTVTPLVRPVVPIVTPVDKPQTTVYIGKIASTVDNEFLLSLLRLCGPVKSWKRAQDPSDGTPKGFGFCEFESAEGILRAMRLLSKLNIDRQELVLNINQATREYLERYVEKKTVREREKLKEAESQIAEKETGSESDVEKQEPSKLIVEEAEKVAEDSVDKENHERTPNFGIVTDEDRDADIDALEKITNMIEERLKTNPLPPTPHVQTPVDGSTKSNSEVPSKSRDGDSDVDILKSAEEKNDDETTSENKPVIEHEKPETSSPVKGRRHDRRSVERDRGRDMKREKEWQLERYERERERARVRKERERELKLREAERLYRDRVKEWEAGEREKEHQRQRQREREKEHQRERHRDILKDENESDDGDRSKRRHRSVYEEKRRKRQREKEDDLTDRSKEEEEIAEAKKRAIEEKPSKDDLKPPPSQMTNESDIVKEMSLYVEGSENAPDHVHESVSDLGINTDAGIYRNNNGCDPTLGSSEGSDMKQNSSAPSRKLGFGLVGSGKRTSVPSVFHEEDDEGVDDKKMRPLVPIDYSTEELQAVQSNVSGPPNLVAAAEFAKRISNVNTREDKRGIEREMNGRSNDRLHRDRDRNVENARARNESKEKAHDKIFDHERDREDKHKTGNTKLLDAKQLIDMIPKTKEELFAYVINWSLYDKYELHERMRPWISKKITEFLGEDEPTLVDYIVSSTKDHVHASKMLELLQSILDDEAEMFVLKMWRMLIFEIKKVETGLSGKSRV